MPVARDSWVRELHYRRFRKGVQGMSVFTHDDYVALIQQYPYVIGRSYFPMQQPDPSHRTANAAYYHSTTCYVVQKASCYQR